MSISFILKRYGVLDNFNGIGVRVSVTANGVMQTLIVGANVHSFKSSHHRRFS